MAWETVEKKRAGGVRAYGPRWETDPAVSVSKTCVTFNAKFIKAFLGDRSEVLLLIDREHKKLGVRVTGEQDAAGFRISQRSKRCSESSARSMANSQIAKAFPEAVGYAYEAHLNPGERVIEISLTPDNRLR